MLQLLYQSLMTKLSTPPFLNASNIKKHNTKVYIKFTYLFTTLSSNAYNSHEFTTLRNCWTFGTISNAVDSAIGCVNK